MAKEERSGVSHSIQPPSPLPSTPCISLWWGRWGRGGELFCWKYQMNQGWEKGMQSSVMQQMIRDDQIKKKVPMVRPFNLFKHTITQSLIQSLEMVLADTEIIWKISPGLLLISATTPTPTLIRPCKSSSKNRKKKVAFLKIFRPLIPFHKTLWHIWITGWNSKVKEVDLQK